MFPGRVAARGAFSVPYGYARCTRADEEGKDEQSQENWEFKNKPRSSGGRGSSREKQPDGDLARLVALAVAGAKKGSEKKRLSSGGKSGS